MVRRRGAFEAVLLSALLVPLAAQAQVRGHDGAPAIHPGGGNAHFGGVPHFAAPPRFVAPRMVTPNLAPPHYVAPPTLVPHQVLPQSVEPARIEARPSLEERRPAGAAPLPAGGGFAVDARQGLAPHRMPLLAGGSRPIGSVRLSTNHNWHHWRRVPGFLGWAGPLYWPYAYDDIYDDVLWGGPAYGDPFWDYNYGDLYGAIFSPYSYPEVAPFLPGGETLPGYRAGGTEVQAMCGSDSSDIAGWPIDRLTRLLEPATDQRALLDELANASERAAQAIKEACTATAALTPVNRLPTLTPR
jgi:hypothetical protein